MNLIQSKPKILLVEDDDAIRSMYKIKFEIEGLTVATAKDGKEALKQAVTIRPTLLLLDIKIPFFGGEEVLHKLRRFDWGKNMKVIIMSNTSVADSPPQLNDLGYDHYLIKAHKTPGQIMSIIHDVLGKVAGYSHPVAK